MLQEGVVDSEEKGQSTWGHFKVKVASSGRAFSYHNDRTGREDVHKWSQPAFLD